MGRCYINDVGAIHVVAGIKTAGSWFKTDTVFLSLSLADELDGPHDVVQLSLPVESYELESVDSSRKSKRFKVERYFGKGSFRIGDAIFSITTYVEEPFFEPEAIGVTCKDQARSADAFAWAYEHFDALGGVKVRVGSLRPRRDALPMI